MMNVSIPQSANAVASRPRRSRKTKQQRVESQTPTFTPPRGKGLAPKWDEWFKALGGEWQPAD